MHSSFVQDQFTTAGLETQLCKSGDNLPIISGGQLASDVYGHIRYICPQPVHCRAHMLPRNPTWQYRWNVGTALHVSEIMPIWHNGTTAAGVFIHSYWASFIRSFDPNKYPTQFFAGKGTSVCRARNWQQYSNSTQRRIFVRTITMW